MQRKRMQLTEMHSNPALIPSACMYAHGHTEEGLRGSHLRDGKRRRRKAGGIERLWQQRGVNDEGDGRIGARQQRGRRRDDRQAGRRSGDCGQRRLWVRRLPFGRSQGLLRGM